MDVMVAATRTANLQGSERNRSGSEAMLLPKSEQDHPEAAEYLLELLTVDEIAATLRVSPSWVYKRVRKRGRELAIGLKGNQIELGQKLKALAS
jgi:hypothetical protein